MSNKSSPIKRKNSDNVEKVITNKRFKALLEEFDLEVSSRVDSMKRYAESLEIPIKNVYWKELSRLPTNIKKMPISEFCEKYNGDINMVIQNNVDTEIKEIESKCDKKNIESSKSTNESLSKLLSEMKYESDPSQIEEALKNLKEVQNRLMEMKNKTNELNKTNQSKKTRTKN